MRTDEGAPLVPGVAELTLLHSGPSTATYRGFHRRSRRAVVVELVVGPEPEAIRVRRFERECDILGRLSGQSWVLRLFDSGYLHGGVPYLVTELCDQGSVAQRLAADGPRPVAEVVEVGRRIGAALADLHGIGVLHRNVTPDTVLLRADGSPVLAGFRLARGQGDPEFGPPAVSPGFTAPEALAAGRWSTAADVFALGSTLLAMLQGVRPALGGGLDAAGLRRVLCRPGRTAGASGALTTCRRTT
jgi:serine/threonine-protein kinase PknK